MVEIQERAIKASEIRTGDRLVLSARLVTQVSTKERSVFLYHPEGGHTTCDLDTPVKILRRVRVEPPEDARPVVHTTDTPKGLQRPSQGREWGSL